METPYVTEEYFCVHCDKPLVRNDVYVTWDCPACKNKVHIRIITHEKDNACYRVLPHELNIDDIILTSRFSEFYSILRVTDQGNHYLINLKNQGGWKTAKDKYVLKVDGRWHH